MTCEGRRQCGGQEIPGATGGSARDRVRRYYRVVSPFIDRENPGRRDEVLWRRLAERYPGGAALDLGCGTGRIAGILAGDVRGGPAGRMDPVVGIDLSPEMILRARDRMHRRTRPVRLVVADLRRPPLYRRFDLVVAGGDPFAHLLEDEDRDRGLSAVAEHLAPGGRFVLDALWFPPDDLARALTRQGLELEHGGAGLTVCELWRCSPDGRCRARYEYRRRGEVLETAGFRGRHWTVSEVHRRFTRAGLEVEHLWGDYEGAVWDPVSAEGLVVEATIRP